MPGFAGRVLTAKPPIKVALLLIQNFLTGCMRIRYFIVIKPDLYFAK